MKARVTISLSANGTLELWLNEEGRDQLVRELQALNETNDHFHLMLPAYGPSDLPLSPVSYRPSDKIVDVGKVLFRPNHWDQSHYPNVLDDAK